MLEQVARQLQIFLQRKNESTVSSNVHWRPFVVSISDASLTRKSAFDITRWIAYKYGFGTYIHYIKDTWVNKLLSNQKISNIN